MSDILGGSSEHHLEVADLFGAGRVANIDVSFGVIRGDQRFAFRIQDGKPGDWADTAYAFTVLEFAANFLPVLMRKRSISTLT